MALETLLLVRHAHAPSNRDSVASSAIPGDGLTAEGVEQAKRLAGALASEPVDLGVASELRRTQETLELGLAGRDVPWIVVPELDEIHFGRFDGGPLEVYRAWAAAESPDVPAPGGGESRAAAAARFARGLKHVLAQPAAHVVVVGHALVLRYIVDAACGLVPAPRMAPVEHAKAQRLTATEALAAVELLEKWSRAPRFRDTSNER